MFDDLNEANFKGLCYLTRDALCTVVRVTVHKNEEKQPEIVDQDFIQVLPRYIWTHEKKKNAIILAIQGCITSRCAITRACFQMHY